MATRTVTWGEAVKAAREAKGWTQAELAARIGVSYSTVQKWEGPGQEPKLGQVQRVQRVFGWSKTFLLSLDAMGRYLSWPDERVLCSLITTM